MGCVCDNLERPLWPLPCCWITGSIYRGIPNLPQPRQPTTATSTYYGLYLGRGSLDWAELSFLTPLKWLQTALQIPTSLGSC